RATVRCHLRDPPLVRVVHSSFESIQALREISAVGGTKLGELVRDFDRHTHGIGGIEPIVRVAKRVDIAHRAVDIGGRPLEDLYAEGKIEIALLSWADVVVAALIQQRRKPSDFELEADNFQQIRLPKQKQKARFRLDEVWILVTLADRSHVDAIAADFARNR